MNELKLKLDDCQGNPAKGQEIMKTLKKENEVLAAKLEEVESKAQDLAI